MHALHVNFKRVGGCACVCKRSTSHRDPPPSPPKPSQHLPPFRRPPPTQPNAYTHALTYLTLIRVSPMAQKYRGGSHAKRSVISTLRIKRFILSLIFNLSHQGLCTYLTKEFQFLLSAIFNGCYQGLPLEFSKLRNLGTDGIPISLATTAQGTAVIPI